MNTKSSIASHLANRTAPTARAVILCGTIAFLGACASEPDSHVVSSPPPPPPNAAAPVVVSQTTTTTPSQTTTMTPSGQMVTTQSQPVSTVVVTAPPAAQSEGVLAQPGPDYVWVPGYWTWRDSRYEWMAGHWEIPPHASAVWVAPRYETENGGYRFYEGYWN